MRLQKPKLPSFKPRARVGDTVYYLSPVNKYAVKRSVVVEIRNGHEQVMQNGDVVKSYRRLLDYSTFPTRDAAVSHVMATLIESINGRQKSIDTLIREQEKERRILATMRKQNPEIEPKRYDIVRPKANTNDDEIVSDFSGKT